MKNNYDKIAPYYDVLSRLVYGRILVRAQVVLLPYIKPGSRVLIAGGGTGWILEEIARLSVEGLVIDYVDMSCEMIRLAQRRNAGDNTVNFYQQDIALFRSTMAYDIIFTPFLFDNFADESARDIFLSLDSQLAGGGSWLFADFFYEPGHARWKKWLLGIMYLFFRVCCNVESHKLPDMASLFGKRGYAETEVSRHLRGFIRSLVYNKR